MKDTFLSAFGSMAAFGHVTAGDEVLKNSFANLAFENSEIAAYAHASTIVILDRPGRSVIEDTRRLTLTLRVPALFGFGPFFFCAFRLIT